MVKKLQKNTVSKSSHAHLTGSVKDSAQQIWQAGLGAFTRAQAEGSKAFESLVKEGVSIQRKTAAVAEEKISEATTKMSTMATDITSKATGQWDKLENIFEERVAKAPEAPKNPDSVEAMAHRMKTEAGKEFYAQRKSTVEPVFGIIKEVMGFRRFMRRGLDAVNGEWTLVCMAFNLKRLCVLRFV